LLAPLPDVPIGLIESSDMPPLMLLLMLFLLMSFSLFQRTLGGSPVIRDRTTAPLLREGSNSRTVRGDVLRLLRELQEMSSGLRDSGSTLRIGESADSTARNARDRQHDRAIVGNRHVH